MEDLTSALSVQTTAEGELRSAISLQTVAEGVLSTATHQLQLGAHGGASPLCFALPDELAMRRADFVGQCHTAAAEQTTFRRHLHPVVFC